MRRLESVRDWKLELRILTTGNQNAAVGGFSVHADTSVNEVTASVPGKDGLAQQRLDGQVMKHKSSIGIRQIESQADKAGFVSGRLEHASLMRITQLHKLAYCRAF